MTVEKYVKVELGQEERDTLRSAAEIIDELRNAVGDDEYDIDFEEISYNLQRIVYMDCFEINTRE